MALLIACGGGAHAQESLAPASRPPAADTEASRVGELQFEAVLAALRAYEESVPSLVWEQSTAIVRATDSGNRMRTTAEFVMARDGRWAMRFRPNEDAPSERSFFDGSIVYRKQLGSSDGAIVAVGIEWWGAVINPIMIAIDAPERRLASPRMTRRSDTIAALQEVEVDSSADPLIRITGSMEDGGEWKTIEMTLDRSRGFMPVSVIDRSDRTGEMTSRLIATNAEEVGGVWIPSEGRRQGWSTQSMGLRETLGEEEYERRSSRYEAALAQAGLDLSKRADRARARALQKQIYGSLPFGPQPLGGGEWQLRAWNVRVLDDALAAELLKPPFDEGDKVFDSRTREICYWRGGKLVKEDGTPVVLDAAAAAKPAASEPKPASPSPSPSPQQPPEATPAPKPQAGNAKP